MENPANAANAVHGADCANRANSDPAPRLLVRPQGPYAPPEELHRYKGCLLTRREIEQVHWLGHQILPATHLIRTLPDDPAPPFGYRRRAYGPYDHLPAEMTHGEPRVHVFRGAPHWGQTKLCVSEVEGIDQALAVAPGIRHVLYAGAAPGEHIAFLAELYPGLRFTLIDPAEFRVHHRYAAFPGVGGRITVERALFTDETAAAWEARGPETFFICDIRTGSSEQDDYESEVWSNMQMMRRWVGLMGPAAALLKFRLPYTDGVAPPPVEYLDGRVYIQAFGPNTTTEARLFIVGRPGPRLYDPKAYEDWHYWHNTAVREWASYDHGLDLGLVPGLCRCYDCSRTVQVFRDHVRARGRDGGDPEVARLIRRMTEATGQSLLRPPHGTDVGLLPADRRPKHAAEHSRGYCARRDKKISQRQGSVQYAPPRVQSHVRPPGAPQRRLDDLAAFRGSGSGSGSSSPGPSSPGSSSPGSSSSDDPSSESSLPSKCSHTADSIPRS